VKSKKHNQYKQNQRNDFDDSADCVDDSRLPDAFQNQKIKAPDNQGAADD